MDIKTTIITISKIILSSQEFLLHKITYFSFPTLFDDEKCINVSNVKCSKKFTLGAVNFYNI